jgi:beta-N-acetylhexosaminidase
MSPASSPRSNAPAAIILGCSGPVLTQDERLFFADFDPVGFILFARNCETPEQVRALTTALRDSVGRADAPILIDQEGGRVARLKPPHWPEFPPMRVFGEMAERNEEAALEACRLNASLIGYELARLGIDVDCAPVLDLPAKGAHDVIGDRAFGVSPELTATLGRAVCEGLKNAGVIPIVKHIPGHGRALVDSHAELPEVDAARDVLAETDFLPFRLLNDMAWAMVAHVRYTAIDAMLPASASPLITETILRGEIGFDGVLIADDIGMEALTGTLAERAAATLAGGADLTLHCSGKLNEMVTLAPALRPITPQTQARLERGRHGLNSIDAAEAAQARARLDALMAQWL